MTHADFDQKSKKQDGEGVASEARREARDTFENVKQETVTQARKTSDHVRRTAENSLESGKSHLSAQVGSVSKAIHRGSESFREDGQEELAEQSEHLAERVDSVRSLIDDYGAEGAYDEVRRLSRERPAWLIGGAMALGGIAAAVISSRRGGSGRGRR